VGHDWGNPGADGEWECLLCGSRVRWSVGGMVVPEPPPPRTWIMLSNLAFPRGDDFDECAETVLKFVMES
jgi:hypothetical protein